MAAEEPKPEQGPSRAALEPPAGHGRNAEELGFAALLVVSVVGVAIAEFSARWGFSYWVAMVPLFAAASIYTGWKHSAAGREHWRPVLLRQVLHWGALGLAVYLIFLLERTGQLNREDAGLVAMLSLALTSLLAGVHFDWRLAVLGALLGVATACTAFVEEFFWVVLVLAVLAGVVVIVWQRRRS